MKTEFDDALRGVYSDYSQVQQEKASEYRSIGPLSIASFVFGLLSFVTFLYWPLAIIPITGVILGAVAIRRMAQSPDEVAGFEFASLGVGLSIFFWFIGYGWIGWQYYHSVPSGYVKITFEQLMPDPETKELPQELIDYAKNGQKIYIEGYMYQTSRMTGIEHFALVRTVEHCKFCSRTDQSNSFNMIDVALVGGKTTVYKTSPIKVGGILHVNPNFNYMRGELPYAIEADVCR